jgi:hypothetical protein
MRQRIDWVTILFWVWMTSLVALGLTVLGLSRLHHGLRGVLASASAELFA